MNIAYVSVAPILLIAILSIPLAVIDIRQHRLPNVFTYTAISGSLLATFITSAATDRWVEFGSALVAGLLTAIIGYLLVRIKAIGMGDIKLLIAMHISLAWHSPVLVLMSLGLGFGLATIVGVIGLAIGRLRPRSMMPLGPYLLFGFLLVGAIPSLELFTVAALS
ncbi:MAG: prepilin peptidase [Aquiluna sp.]|nr:prepilin peptidase [Aquiluna sp.]